MSFTDFSRFMQSDDLKPFEFVNPYDIPQPEVSESRQITDEWIELRKAWVHSVECSSRDAAA